MTRFSVLSRTAKSGFATWNRPIRAASQAEAKAVARSFNR